MAFHLVVTSSGGDVLGVGAAPEADGLSGGGGIERLLRGLPGAGERARIGVRP